jgi:hypothetical protein
MGRPILMSLRLYFPLHSGRPYWDCPSQLLSRYCPSRHILRCSPLPLRTFYGRCLRHSWRVRALIPPIYRLYPTRDVNKNPLLSDVRRRKRHILPPTLPWTSRNATTVLRLPRRLYPLKHSLLYWVPNLAGGGSRVPIYPLRSICFQT